MCRCHAEMLVLNSADDKLSTKNRSSNIHIQSLGSVFGPVFYIAVKQLLLFSFS